MATIYDLVASGDLELYALPDWESRLAVRRLWATQQFWAAIDSQDDLHEIRRGDGGRSRFEHLELTFNDFRCAERIPAGDLKRVMPTRDGVWKMHPPKLRVYGWCPFKHSFVAVSFAREEDTKSDKGLNDAMLGEVRNFINRHGLQDSIERGDIRAVFPPN
jgi:hypothetical protein